LILKNKNLRIELVQKHILELQNVTENIRKNLVLLHTGEPSLDIRALTSTTITRRIPSPQPKPNIRSPFKISFKGNDFQKNLLISIENEDPKSLEMRAETAHSIDATKDEVIYDGRSFA
jgi:hypothetical protein